MARLGSILIYLINYLMLQIVNYTKHPLRVYVGDTEFNFEPQGEVRCVFRAVPVERIDLGTEEIPVYMTKYSEVINLDLIDETKSNIIYVVSRHTAIAIKELYPNRYNNVVFPNEVERSQYDGKPLGCRSFARA